MWQENTGADFKGGGAALIIIDPASSHKVSAVIGAVSEKYGLTRLWGNSCRGGWFSWNTLRHNADIHHSINLALTAGGRHVDALLTVCVRACVCVCVSH